MYIYSNTPHTSYDLFLLIKVFGLKCNPDFVLQIQNDKSLRKELKEKKIENNLDYFYACYLDFFYSFRSKKTRNLNHLRQNIANFEKQIPTEETDIIRSIAWFTLQNNMQNKAILVENIKTLPELIGYIFANKENEKAVENGLDNIAKSLENFFNTKKYFPQGSNIDLAFATLIFSSCLFIKNKDKFDKKIEEILDILYNKNNLHTEKFNKIINDMSKISGISKGINERIKKLISGAQIQNITNIDLNIQQNTQQQNISLLSIYNRVTI